MYCPDKYKPNDQWWVQTQWTVTSTNTMTTDKSQRNAQWWVPRHSPLTSTSVMPSDEYLCIPGFAHASSKWVSALNNKMSESRSSLSLEKLRADFLEEDWASSLIFTLTDLCFQFPRAQREKRYFNQHYTRLVQAVNSVLWGLLRLSSERQGPVPIMWEASAWLL